MEAFALYLLKSVIWLSGFSLVYLLFLRNERFFLLNRLYLLSGILTSFLFPFISVHYTVVLPVVYANQPDNSQIGLQIAGYGKTLFPGLLPSVAYLAGVVIVIYTKFRQNKPVLKAIKNAEIITSYPVKLIKTTDYDCSFSFFSYVFVNPSITDIETEEIVNHELAHIRQRHWFDLVLVELLCILQWFNPLAWIYIRFIKQNHEYLADEVALQRTSDPAVYKATLLNQIVGSPVVSLANSINYSLNKKRFKMMKNIISSPYRKTKVLLILPVFAIVLYAFAKPDYKYKYADESSGSLNAGTSLQQKTVKGSVVQQDGKPLPGVIITVKGTTMGSITDAEGHFKLVNIADDGLLVVSFVGFKSKVLKPVFTSEMTITMVRDTVKYLKGNISTPPPPPPPMDAAEDINVPTPPPPTSSDNADGRIPLYVVDEITVTSAEAEKIDPSSIEFVNVLKNKSETEKPATDKYGEKGKDGVFEITTKKKAVEDYNKTIKIYNNPDSLGKLLVIIDGVVHEKDGMSAIRLDDIETMSVLTEKLATEKYGEKGKNGAIEIKSRNNESHMKRAGSINISADSMIMYKDSIVIVHPKPYQNTDNVPFIIVEEMPAFPGGTDAMVAWINANLKYPAEAVKAKITGKVLVNFIVASTGKVENVTVVKSVSPLLNAEAVRVVSSMPDWKPGVQGGKPVDVNIRVAVNFNLK